METDKKIAVGVELKLDGLKKDISKIKGSFSKFSIGGQGDTKQTEELKENFNGLKDTLIKIKNLEIADLFTNIFKGGTSIGKTNAQMKALKKEIKTIKKEIKELDDEFKAASNIGDVGTMEAMGDEAAKALEEIHKKTETVTELTKKKLKGIVGIIIKVIATIMGAFTALAISAKKVSQSVKGIADAARKIGFSVNEYQKWGYILENIGVEADNLVDFVKGISAEQAQLIEGNEDTIKTFERLGLSMDRVANMGQQELFTETIKGLQGIENSVERTALAYKIFGEEDAANLTPILNMNADAMARLIKQYEMLGGTASKELIERSNHLEGAALSLKIAWQGFKNVIAQLVIPILTVLTNALTKVVVALRLFFTHLFGVKLTKPLGGFGNASDGMNKFTGSIKGATNAAKELKRQVMGFDELNRLEGPDSGSGSAAAGAGAGIGGNIPDMSDLPIIEPPDLSGIQEFFDKYGQLIADLVKTSLIGIGVVGTILCLMGGNIPGAIGFAAMAGLGITLGFTGGFFKRAADSIVKIAKGIWESIKQIFEPIFDWLDEKVFTPIKNFLSKAAKWIYANVIQPVIDFFEPIVDTISDVFKLYIEKVKEIISGIVNAVTTVINKVVEVYNKVKEIFLALGKAFYDHIIKPVIDFVVSIAQKVYNNAIKPVIDFFVSLGKGFYNHVIKPAFDKIIWLKNQMTTYFKAIAEFVINFAAGTFKKVINGILSTIERTINGFLRLLNSAIGIINKIPGVNITRVKLIDIPKLATGGITKGSTLANIGEDGREAVLPLDKNTEWMDKLADKVAGRQAAPSQIILQLDGHELGRATVDSINALTRQTGRLQLVY